MCAILGEISTFSYEATETNAQGDKLPGDRPDPGIPTSQSEDQHEEDSTDRRGVGSTRNEKHFCFQAP